MEDDEQHELTQRVKRLFEKLDNGQVKLGHVPQLIEALKQVKFDVKGNPILDTVARPVRLLANSIEHFQDEAGQTVAPATNALSLDVLGRPTDVSEVTLLECSKEGKFFGLTYDLYKESAQTVVLSAGISQDPSAGIANRNHAICAGLLVRIGKLMKNVLALSQGADNGEVIIGVNRMILESLTNLLFLLKNKTSKFFDQFVELSLGPERELYDLVKANVAKRNGKILPIEERMLSSIEEYCKKSGVQIETVSAKHQNWGGDMRQKLEKLNLGMVYSSSYRMSSHTVHGTWVDLLLSHLDYQNGMFYPNFESLQIDARVLLPHAHLALVGALEYLRTYFGNFEQIRQLCTRIEDLLARIDKVEVRHEKWLQQNRLHKADYPSSGD